jgi:hypothetical protein
VCLVVLRPHSEPVAGIAVIPRLTRVRKSSKSSVSRSSTRYVSPNWPVSGRSQSRPQRVVRRRLTGAVAARGHATLSITLDTYSHAIPAMQEEAAALIAGLVFAAS